METSDKTERIRQLNDALRCHLHGGQVFMTSGIEALGTARVMEVLCAVATFDAFTKDNDPYGEHDCATLSAAGHRIIWKIDYYDSTFTAASPDPSDPSDTRRVLTIMLAEEY